MPTVPRVTSPQVGPAAAPNLALGVPAGGTSAGGVGNALQQIGTALGREDQRIAEEEQRNQDELRVQQALINLQQHADRVLYDPRDGLAAATGPALFEGAEPATVAFSERARALQAEFLQNDRQRQAFAGRATNEVGQFRRFLKQRLGNERFRIDQETTRAGRDQAIKRAVNLVGAGALTVVPKGRYAHEAETLDDTAIAAVLADHAPNVEAFARRHANRLEVPAAEWFEGTLREDTAAVHTAVLEQALAQGNDALAEAYFERHAEALDPDDRIRLQRVVTAAGQVGEAERRSEDLVDRFYNATKARLSVLATSDRPFSLNDQRVAAKTAARSEIADVGMRDEVLARVDRTFDDLERDQEARLRDASDRLKRKAFEDGIDAATKDADWLELPVETQTAIIGLVQDRNAGRLTVTKAKDYAALKRQAREDPAAFVARDLELLSSVIGPDEMRSLQQTQQVVASQLARDEEAQTEQQRKLLAGFLSTAEIVRATFDEHIGPTLSDDRDDKDENDRIFSKYELEVDRAIRAQQALAEKLLQTSGIETIALDLARQVTLRSGLFFDRELPAFRVSPETVGIDDIPTEEVEVLRDAALLAGRDASDRAIVKQWVTIQRGGGRFE